MIRAFQPTDTSFTSNGDAVLLPTKARVKNSDNGDYYLELTCGTEYNDYLQANNIIVAPTPQGDQAFRIRTINKSKNRIEVKAWHVFYDAQNYLIADSYAVNLTCNEALDHFNRATDNPSPFSMDSDITTVNSFRCVRKSLAECISTVIERWGGHLVRNNWNISVLNNVGVDNGVTIQYKKNLKELKAEYDWANVCTKLLPVGKDGMLLDELYVYSDRQYEIPYTKSVNFSQDIEEEDYIDEWAYKVALKADLLEQAKAYLEQNSLPIVNYTLKGNPERVTDIGDIIEVKDERIGVTVITNVISYEYDAIQERYVSLEFGNFTNNLSNLISNIDTQTQTKVDSAVGELSSTINTKIKQTKEEIWQAFKSSYVIYDGDKILIVDSLPATTATNVIRVDSEGISFSKTGINGTFILVWAIDGTFNAQDIHIINFTLDIIKGGILKLGSAQNEFGKIELYNEVNMLIGVVDKNGLLMYKSNGNYIVINQNVGFGEYDATGKAIVYVDSLEKTLMVNYNLNVNGLRLDDKIYIGNQVIYDHFTTQAAGETVLVCAYNYRLIENIFEGINIPDNYEKAYKITFQGQTANENTITVKLNNISSDTLNTYSDTTFRAIAGTRLFKESELVLEPVYSSSNNGLNLSVENSGAYEANVYNITVHGYLVNKNTDLS